jgi:hypothetical protein
MTKNKFLIISAIFILSSCSFFTKKVETLASPQFSNPPEEKTLKKDLFCKNTNSFQLFFDDEISQKNYLPIIANLFEKKSNRFIQKAVILSLLEMLRRPDAVSPEARFQFLLHYNNQDFYYDIYPNNSEDNKAVSYLKGLDLLLKNFDKPSTLLSLAESIDKQVPANLTIGPELENFLKLNKNEISKNNSLSETFQKGDEVLTKYETFKRISLKKILLEFGSQLYLADSIYHLEKNPWKLVDQQNSSKDIQCNFDLYSDDTLKDQVSQNEDKKSHYFALKDKNDYFVAISSLVNQNPLKSLASTYFIKSKSTLFPIPICQFMNAGNKITLLSTSGRNSSQHLKHLASYDIGLTENFQSLNELLKFSRHLFLSNPDRILYESKKGRKSQLEYFLSMNFPIYHIESLGDIIGVAQFNSTENSNTSLFIDERSKTRIWCGQ